MGKPNFRNAFKRDAVRQITERGYPLTVVSQRPCVGQHSPYAWKGQRPRQRRCQEPLLLAQAITRMRPPEYGCGLK